MRKSLCLILFQALAFASSSSGAQSTFAVPELPRLSLDNFSPGIQEQIEEATPTHAATQVTLMLPDG